MNNSGPKIHTIEGEAQRRAISSPLRLEILEHFSAGLLLSVREVAERMGRPATAIHYHVRLLARERSVEEERRTPRRSTRETEYSMVADAIAVPGHGQSSEGGEHTLALKTTASAFRMAERDMKAALAEGAARSEGDHRNFYATRVHLRLSREGDGRDEPASRCPARSRSRVDSARRTPG